MSILLDHGSKLKLQELKKKYFEVAEMVFVHCYDSGYPGTEENRFIDHKYMPERLRDKIFTVKVDLEDCISLARLWSIRALPTVLLFTLDEIIWRHEGPVDVDKMMKALNKM